MQQARRDISTDYTHDRNTLIRDVAARVEDRIGLEIGDSKSGEFIPQAKILRWDNEVNFSIRRDNGARSFVERDGKIVAESKDENVVIYELEPDEQNEDGGLEIEIELPRRPKTNVFEFTLETKGLNFYYQAELTEEEKAEGASQPENVIGSYAVYHATKRDNRVGGKHYKTGKAFHIYRPKAIDADGAEVWCELNIDEVAGILTVTVPQQWLNRASYPVRVDPTFGYTSVGGSTGNIGARATNSYNTSVASLGESASVTSISAYLSNNSSDSPLISFYIYTDSSSYPNALQRETEIWNTPASFAELRVFNFSTAVEISAGTYWLGGFRKKVSGNRGIRYSYDSTIGTFNSTDNTSSSFSFSGPADPFPAGGTARERIFTIYATYTAAASEEPPTVTTQAVSSIAETTATGNGNVTDDGGATITERGVCWSTSPTPTTADSKATAAGTTGAFTASITGLTASTTYYVRAYAINSEGTSYGAQVSFTTDAALTEYDPLIAALGSFSLTGQAVTLRRTYHLDAVADTFTFTGQATTFRRALRLSADSGPFAVTGQAAALIRTLSIAPEAQTFALTGLATALRVSRRIEAQTASYALTGLATGLLYARVLGVETGAFALTGQEVRLGYNRRLDADTGTFALTGTAADLDFHRRVQASTGDFTLSGIAADFIASRKVSPETGTFALIGFAVSLTYEEEIKLTANTGAFALTGGAAGLTVSRVLSLDTAAFALSGANLGLTAARLLQAQTATYTATGSDIDFARSYQLAPATGSFALTGTAISTSRAYVLGAAPGAYTLTGPNVALTRTLLLATAPASYTFAGNTAELVLTRSLQVEPAAFILSGVDAGLLASFVITPNTGSFTLTGNAAAFDTFVGFRPIFRPRGPKFENRGNFSPRGPLFIDRV